MGSKNTQIKAQQEVKAEQAEQTSGYHPLLDPVFQRWMSDTYICSEFLEAVTGRKIENLQIHTQYEIFQPNIDLRKIRLDVRATEESFQIFNIEAQIKHNSDHYDRTLYYACMQISSQLEKSDPFSKLKKTTVIFINENNTDSDSFIETAELLRSNDSSVFSDKLKIIYINLNNISRSDDNASDKLKFFALFCLLGHHENELNVVCQERNLDFSELRNNLVMKLKEIRGDTTMQDQIAIYNDFHKNREEVLPMDLIDRIKAEGKEEGRDEGKVLAFHEVGMSLAEIARRVGITLAEVNNILAAS
ncbi:MAG: Rpn family recombination-promoting nuclease/putative transposase [Clostridiales bacterium]|jgi:predicted transposase/invertase (TIGR01784 family)|nr:Rpn family recombination-promoting nuclease/putative transposase [Clostridiales bacterium]